MSDAALLFECEKCGAEPHRPCVEDDGMFGFETYPHPARELKESRAEAERLVTRQQELLATIVRLSNETPFSDEAKDALEQRGKLVVMPCEHVMLNCSKCTRERDSLKSEVERLKAENAQLARLNSDAVGRAYHDVLLTKQRDSARRECSAVRAENERMRAVYEAAIRHVGYGDTGELAQAVYEIDERIARSDPSAIDQALASKEPPP